MAAVSKKFQSIIYQLKPSLPVGGFLICFALSAVFLSWRLVSITHGRLNAAEQSSLNYVTSVHPWWKILASINGPYNFVAAGLYKLHPDLFFFRLPSAICGLVSSLALYWLVSKWHGYKIGVLSALLYLTSFGVLVISRQATPMASELLPVTLLILATAWLKGKGSFLRLLAFVVISSGLIYLPGDIWLVILALIICFRDIIDTFIRLGFIKQTAIILLGPVLISPLGYYFYKHYSLGLIAHWLGYGLHGRISALKTYGHNLLRVPLDLFIRSSHLAPALTLGNSPLIPVAVTILIILGFIGYVTRLSNYRWRSVLLFLLFGWLLIGFGVVSVYLLLPLTAIMAGTGMAYLLKEWYAVFPKNPIARYSGLMIMIAVIAFISFFQLRTYFVAWAYNVNTDSAYRQPF